MATKRVLIGGSFAPPIDSQKLDQYEALAQDADRRVKEYMLDLVKMLRVFWETGESEESPQKATLGHMITPLEDQEIERIWDVVPWPEECDVIGTVFDQLPNGELRNAAYHLLWYARELAADREPTTSDKVNLA